MLLAFPVALTFPPLFHVDDHHSLHAHASAAPATDDVVHQATSPSLMPQGFPG